MDPQLNSPPHRPMVPPKPDKISHVTSSPESGSSAGCNISISNSTSTKSPETRNVNGNHEDNLCPDNKTLKSPPLVFQKPPVSPQKPALPPKPSSSLSPPIRSASSPTANISRNSTSTTPVPNLPRGRNSISIANQILANRDQKNVDGPHHQPRTGDINTNTQPQNVLTPAKSTPNVKKLSPPDSPTSPDAVLRRNPDFRAPSLPLSPRPTSFNATPRPFSSIFSFPSPSSTDLRQHSHVIIPAQRNSEILRGKSASLGRNCAPPPTSSGGFFSNKAATLARMLPLDLHFGKNPSKSSNSSVSNISKPPIMQHFNPPPVHNLGRNISFSNNSPIPPPPPPRLKKKLSPVNSLSPVSSLSPSSPPPVFSPGLTAPTNPVMIPLPEEPVIYAEVDKEKKWAARKLKEETTSKSNNEVSSISVNRMNSVISNEASEEIQGSLTITINRETDSKKVTVHSVPVQDESKDKDGQSSQLENQPVINTKIETKLDVEGVVVDSWLGKYLTGPVIPIAKSKVNAFESCEKSIISEQNDTPLSSLSFDVVVDGAIKDEGAIKIRNEDELEDNKSFLFSNIFNSPPPLNNNEEIKQEEEHNCINNEIKPMDSEICNFDEMRDIIESKLQMEKPEDNNQSNADTIVQSLDTKIQSMVTLISNLSGKVSPSQQISDSPPPPPRRKESTNDNVNFAIPNEELEFKSLCISEESPKVHNDNKNPLQTVVSSPTIAEDKNISKTIVGRSLPGESSIIRRNSWNCSADSSSPYDSSSSSLTNSRERCFTYSKLGWVDEGDSTGYLGAAESSDATVPTSSTEDMGTNTIGRRKRIGMSIFSSFGKIGSSSSSSSNSFQKSHKKQKDKDKTKSIVAQANGKLSRVSDSLMSAVQISAPVVNLPAGPETPISKPTVVQFSPDVNDTPIHRYRYSEGSISSTGDSPMGPLSEKADTESMCSFSSTSTTTLNISGYDDILNELGPKDKKAFYVAREILTSEQTFCDVLHLLTIEFPNTIKEAEQALRHPIVPPQDLDTILGGLPHLKMVNEDLKIDLQERITNWLEKPKLADVIVKKGPFLKHYAHYIKNFEKITEKLDECCQQNGHFAKALHDFEMSNRCQKLGIKHYMLKPVQRMPQYSLLLEDYRKHLEEDGGDYEDTLKAIAIVKDVAEHANEAIRLQVNANKLMQLQNRLTGSVIMKSDRQLLKEGELQKVCRKGLQPRFFALMNDCLLCMNYYTVGSGSGMNKDLKLRNELPLAGMRVCTTQTEDYQFEFSVISVARSFNLVAKSAKEREVWLKALNDAINDNIRKRACSTPDQEEGFQLGKVAPVWIQDARVTMCQICTAEFTVTFRRHHCRACGKVVCGHCSGNHAPLHYLKNDPVRVCDECYQFLLEEFDKDARDSFTSDGLETSRDTLRMKFKKMTPNVSKRAAKMKRSIPSRLEVQANNSGSRISGYLHWRERKAWKRHWFVLMDRVLYIYAASEDIAAVRSIPVLGWTVEVETSESMDGTESDSVFKLIHYGQSTLFFQAENCSLAERWVSAMSEATVLT